jgi:hypothetical protein
MIGDVTDVLVVLSVMSNELIPRDDPDGMRTFSNEWDDAETFSTISRGEELDEFSDD